MVGRITRRARRHMAKESKHRKQKSAKVMNLSGSGASVSSSACHNFDGRVSSAIVHHQDHHVWGSNRVHSGCMQKKKCSLWQHSSINACWNKLQSSGQLQFYWLGDRRGTPMGSDGRHRRPG